MGTNTKEKAALNGRGLVMCCIRGVLTALPVGAALLLTLALLLLYSPDPLSLSYLGYVALSATCMLCGLISCRRYGKKPLLCGLISGSVLVALVLCASVLSDKRIVSFMPLLCILCSVIGAFVGGAIPLSYRPTKAKRSNPKLYLKYKK